jgi:hypothetical protein
MLAKRRTGKGIHFGDTAAEIEGIDHLAGWESDARDEWIFSYFVQFGLVYIGWRFGLRKYIEVPIHEGTTFLRSLFPVYVLASRSLENPLLPTSHHTRPLWGSTMHLKPAPSWKLPSTDYAACSPRLEIDRNLSEVFPLRTLFPIPSSSSNLILICLSVQVHQFHSFSECGVISSFT